MQNILGTQEGKISGQEAIVVVWSERELFSRAVHVNHSLFFFFLFFILTHSLIFEKHKPFLWHCVIFLHVSINLGFEEVTGILVICQQYPQRICECHREVLRFNSFLNLHVSVIPYSLVHTQEAYYIWLAIS